MLGRFTAVAAAIALALNFSAAGAAHADASGTPPDFSGAWKLDPSKIDMPARPDNGGRGGGGRGGMMGGGGGGRHGGGGGWGGGMGRGGGGGGYGRHGGGEEGDAPGTPPEGATAGVAAGAASGRGGHLGMPSYLRVAQTSAELEFSDSAGTEVREIALVAAPFDSNMTQPKVPRDPGEWEKNKLEVEKLGPGDLKIKEEFSLEDAGQTLVVKTHVDGGRNGSREIKRVYRKVSAS